jgi:YggT family protein
MLSNFIDLFFNALYLALFARVILSWIPINPYNPIIEILHMFTDPLLKPFQNLVPANKIGIDISPIFAAIALEILRKVLLVVFGL